MKKTTTFKFKDDLTSNGEWLSDGHFMAKIDLSGIAWKCPNDQCTAKLINRETFHYRYGNFDTQTPDIAAILNGEKEACHVLTDTGVVLKHSRFDIRLYHNPVIGYMGIDEKYQFLLEGQTARTKDTTYPIFVTDRCVIMPMRDPLDGFWRYIAQ